MGGGGGGGGGGVGDGSGAGRSASQLVSSSAGVRFTVSDPE